jgi:hypothetical protein
LDCLPSQNNVARSDLDPAVGGNCHDRAELGCDGLVIKGTGRAQLQECQHGKPRWHSRKHIQAPASAHTANDGPVEIEIGRRGHTFHDLGHLLASGQRGRSLMQSIEPLDEFTHGASALLHGTGDA